MSSKTHSTSGEMFRMGIAAAAGAAAAYGGRALLKQWPAIMASAAVGQVGKVADKVKDGAVEGVSRVSDGARQTTAQAASSSRSTAKSAAKKAGSGGSAAAGRTTGAARRTTGAARGTTAAARRTSNGGSAAKSRARKPA